MILLDTSALLSAMDSDDPDQRRTSAAIRSSRGPRLMSPFVLAELDYLLARRVGPAVARRLLDEIVVGAYRLEPFDADDVRRAAAVLDRYRDLELGLADASIVVLAERHGINEIVTLDERHFRAVLGPGGRPFRILPADATAA
ncbi:MAG: VapC toxin family PIN domain ribonuclease [Anaerolinea sp.]|nr:VapC toxin family PIN domain ribonuclease [Anaerolinea sp.]